MDIDIENEYTFREAVLESCNMFLGAGFAVLANGSDDRRLPLGNDLKSELCGMFDVPTSLTLPQVCTLVEHTRQAQLDEYLRARFSVQSFDSRYGIIPTLRIGSVFTTNIDDLIFKIYARSQASYLSDLDIQGPEYGDRRAVNFVALHGCVSNRNRPLVFSTTDLAAAFAQDPDRFHFLTGQMQKLPTLFWGYALEDAAALQALHPRTTNNRPHAPRWITIFPNEQAAVTAQYFRALGFQIIISTTEAMLDYLCALAGSKKATQSANTDDLFPLEAVPAVGTTPVRPFEDFIGGSAPLWHDVYSGRIPRTSHFRGVMNIIQSGQHVCIVGIPASGKTTLLMQLAAEHNYRGYKLFLPNMTMERANLIRQRLDGRPAVIYVDDFADAADAVRALAAEPNIQIVAAERDYQLEITAHKLHDGKRTFRVLDITELSDADVQDCLRAIPPALRRASDDGDWRRENDDDGSQASNVFARDRRSIFEIIEGSVQTPNLRERFATVLKELDREDPALRDLLLMICYVHRSRTAVSMDMMIAFLRGSVGDYQEVYRLRRRLGALVADVVGDLADETQDCFVARSHVAADAVIDVCRRDVFRHMIVRFHENVSPARIIRFDVFRRTAFDNKLFTKAFSDPEQGRQFYEKLFERDGSPYLLQHAALYVSTAGLHKEAFVLIDRAISATAHPIWAIRNSHAIILFRANIEHWRDRVAAETLRRSMTILTQCYQSDRRKPFHAVTFSDLALKYSDRFADEIAKGYLNTALVWLDEEFKRNPWNRSVKRLLPKLRTRVGRL